MDPKSLMDIRLTIREIIAQEDPNLGNTIMLILIVCHDHDTVTDLLQFWVVSTALFAFIIPPTTIFIFEDINRSHLSARDKE